MTIGGHWDFLVNVPFNNSQASSNTNHQTSAQDIIENDIVVEKDEDEDAVIEVMLSDGMRNLVGIINNEERRFPGAWIDFNMIGGGRNYWQKMSLSLKDVCDQSLGHLYRSIPNYQSEKLFKISFLSSTVPDIRKIFVIGNQRYVCRKLSVTYDDSDSFVFEGEFYRLEQ